MAGKKSNRKGKVKPVDNSPETSPNVIPTPIVTYLDLPLGFDANVWADIAEFRVLLATADRYL